MENYPAVPPTCYVTPTRCKDKGPAIMCGIFFEGDVLEYVISKQFPSLPCPCAVSYSVRGSVTRVPFTRVVLYVGGVFVPTFFLSLTMFVFFQLFYHSTSAMKIKKRHRHVDENGMVYLPYLNQWSVPNCGLPKASRLLVHISFLSVALEYRLSNIHFYCTHLT